jgi:hypothetical protein
MTGSRDIQNGWILSGQTSYIGSHGNVIAGGVYCEPWKVMVNAVS